MDRKELMVEVEQHVEVEEGAPGLPVRVSEGPWLFLAKRMSSIRSFLRRLRALPLVLALLMVRDPSTLLLAPGLFRD